MTEITQQKMYSISVAKKVKQKMHIAVCQNVIQNVKCQTDIMRGEKQLKVKC